MRVRLEAIRDAIAGVSEIGVTNSTPMQRYRTLRTEAAAVGDPGLTDAIGRMMSSGIGSPFWMDARGDATHRTGELLKELRQT